MFTFSKTMKLICLAFIVSLFVTQTFANSGCETWEPYKTEKCIKIIDETQTYESAVKSCQQLDMTSTLVSLETNEEQEFLTHFLSTSKIVDEVWLSAKYSNATHQFKWTGGNDVTFTNWASGSPSDSANMSCVQMFPDGPMKGKWANKPCTKKNVPVCQKLPKLSLNGIESMLFKLKKDYENLQKNPVPLGFIYSQLPTQPEPKTLWPAVQWSDVTEKYAGLFFRAEGKGSTAFGQTQEENAPRITEIQGLDDKYDNYPSHQIKLPTGKWSEKIYTGNAGSREGKDGLAFLVSGGEVRPRNTAIRFWKRTM